MKYALLLLIVTLVGVSLLPVHHAETAPFANPSFQSVWLQQTPSTSDGLDVWGNEPLLWRVEPYADAADGRRIVQYFDRGRMELTPDSSGQLIVTEGLLAEEMITGKTYLGATLTEPLTPARIAIDGSSGDDRVPTYASLAETISRRAPDRVGAASLPSIWIDGKGTPTPGPAPVAITAGDYIKASGHNLPSVTTALFQNHPFGSASWLSVMGYPISEPMWTLYRRNNIPLPSLIQVFQRRILVYTPSLPAGSRFTVPNTGRHYYRWRYGTEPPHQWPDPQPGSPTTHITAAAGYQAGIVAQDIGTPVALAIGPTSNLWILTEEGNVLRVDSEHSDGTADHITTFAWGLRNPRGLAVVGSSVYVAADNGIIKFSDADMDGVAEGKRVITSGIEPASGPRGALAADQAGDLFVAGALTPVDRQQTVAEIAPDGTLTTTNVPATRPGPVMVARGQLYVVDSGSTAGKGDSATPSTGANTEEPALIQMPINQNPLATRDALGIAPGQIVAKFASGATINATLMFDSNLWPKILPGTIFAAVSHGDSGSVVRTVAGKGSGPPEVVEFATGFAKPVALAVGLDGSLYVADAGRGQVIKISLPAR